MSRRLRPRPRWFVVAEVAALLAIGVSFGVFGHGRSGSGLGVGSAQAAGFRQPPVRHVFVIMLENEDYASTFGDPTSDPYLARTLPKQGALLQDYYATGHESNDNYISIVSGQPPNVQNQADCHGRHDAARRAPGRDRAGHRPQEGLDDARLLVHHPEPLRRRPRLPCTNQPSGSAALADVDSFLSAWVPKITRSPAFRQNGLLEITFDESDGPQSDSTACCGEQPGPGSPLPGIAGPGGGRIGAVLLSPYIRPGSTTTTAYNHYSSLASWESLLGLSRLADAATVSSTFGPDVFTSAR